MNDQHLDLDTLADLLAGEGSAPSVAHVERCPGCAERLADLEAAEAPVIATLATLPPPPLPEGLAERLSAVLAAAGPLPAVQAVDGPGTATPLPPSEPDEPDRPAARAGSRTVIPLADRVAGRGRTWLPVAAATVLVLSAVGLGTTLLPSGSDDQAASTAGGADSDTGAGLESESSLAGVVSSDSGTDYAPPGTLAAALPALLTGSAATSVAPAPDTVAPQTQAEPRGPSAELDRLHDPAELDGCVSALSPDPDAPLRPLAVDYAAYAGAPAVVVVLPADDDPAKLDVYVVGATCSLADDSTLFFTRLDRPS